MAFINQIEIIMKHFSRYSFLALVTLFSNVHAATIYEIQSVSAVISDVNKIVTDITSLVEQQSATASIIAENVLNAADGIEEVSKNILGNSNFANTVTKDISAVSLATKEMTENSIQVRTNAEDLAILAEQLNEIINQFKIKKGEA